MCVTYGDTSCAYFVTSCRFSTVTKRSTVRTPSLPPLDTATLRRLAVEANCDPRTVAAVAEGTEVRGDAGHRARAALVKAGYLRERRTGGAAK